MHAEASIHACRSIHTYIRYIRYAEAYMRCEKPGRPLDMVRKRATLAIRARLDMVRKRARDAGPLTSLRRARQGPPGLAARARGRDIQGDESRVTASPASAGRLGGRARRARRAGWAGGLGSRGVKGGGASRRGGEEGRRMRGVNCGSLSLFAGARGIEEGRGRGGQDLVAEGDDGVLGVRGEAQEPDVRRLPRRAPRHGFTAEPHGPRPPRTRPATRSRRHGIMAGRGPGRLGVKGVRNVTRHTASISNMHVDARLA